MRSGANAHTNAIVAYEKGATGKGAIIGIVDTGINTSHPEFAGRIHPASTDVVANRGLSDSDYPHGTVIAGIAAAARDGHGMQGIAYDATILAVKANANCGVGCQGMNDTDMAAGVDYARTHGADVINVSVNVVEGAPLPPDIPYYLPMFEAAVLRAKDAGVVVVVAAGNLGETLSNPTNASIVAGSVFPDGTMSTFSSRAGVLADIYLATMSHVESVDLNNLLPTGSWSGTSLSAGIVSGAAALLAGAFPNLTGQQIAAILFDSATDAGAPGTDPVYGRGILNIGRAFQPLGTTSLAGTSTVVSLTGNGALPAAAGDAAASSATEVVVLDSYSRAFALDLGKTLQPASQTGSLGQLQGNVRSAAAAVGPVSLAFAISEQRALSTAFRPEDMGIGPDDARKARLLAASAVARLDDKTAAAFGFSGGAKAMERRLAGLDAAAFLAARDVVADPGFTALSGSSMALRRRIGSLGATISGETGEVWQPAGNTNSSYRRTSVALDRTVGSTSLSAGFSRVEEQETLLGGRISDALGGGSSTTMFMDLEARRKLTQGWAIGAVARRGWTMFGGGRFATEAYAVDVSKQGLFNDSDRLDLRVAQPLRVASGGFAMMLPTAYDYATLTPTYGLTRLSLIPSGREVDAELSYRAPLFGERGWMGANLFARRQPGHVSSAAADVGAAIRFTLGL